MKTLRLMNRRGFLKTGALGSAALLASEKLAVAASMVLPSGNSAETGLRASSISEADFQRPPDAAKPRVWWHWMDGNVTRQGITADLEALKENGLGGAQIFNVAYQIPKGPLKYNSPEWRAMISHAASEAERLGLELAMHNCSGWSSSGGPWITPDKGMQRVVWTETRVHGPARFRSSLPRPQVSRYQDFYRDIAVLACRNPASEGNVSLEAAHALISTGHAVWPATPPPVWPGAEPQAPQSSEPVQDFNSVKDRLDITLPAPARDRPQFVLLTMRQAFTAQSLFLDCRAASPLSCAVQISEDGDQFRTVGTAALHGANQLSFSFPQVSSRYYRLLFTASEGGPVNVQITAIDLIDGYRLPGWPAKAGFTTPAEFAFTPAWDEKLPEGLVYNKDGIVNISAALTGDTLEWDVPEGDWIILRMGYGPNGRVPAHPEDEGRGLEVDKLNREALDLHFGAFIDRLLPQLGPLAGKSFTALLIDSYEVGPQNWTPRFREEFLRLRGYDPIPLLPALTGRVIQSADLSERFLWDIRRTIADLYDQNYYGHFRELCHKRGLYATFEAYAGPYSTMDCSDDADIPMAEFWNGNGYRKSNTRNRLVIASGHMTGKTIIGAEAFTSSWHDDRFSLGPHDMKSLGDLQFAEGINRLIFHDYTMQPFLDRRPGVTMGPWGAHFARTNTWWLQSKAWMEYVARCQYLLQVGSPVLDVLAFTGEDGYAYPHWEKSSEPAVPEGYGFDFINLRALGTTTVEKGILVTGSGQRFRLLVLPDDPYLTIEALRNIERLVNAGATVIGPKPVRCPGLTAVEADHAYFVRTVGELWDSHKVIQGKSIDDVLRELGVAPDFAGSSADGNEHIVYNHRSNGHTDLYFVSNQRDQDADFVASFRATGKVPELWHPDTGTIEEAPVYSESGGATHVPLKLAGSGTVFVIFRKPSTTEDHVASTKTGVFDLRRDSSGLLLRARKNGHYEFTTAQGTLLEASVSSCLDPVNLSDNWEVSFPPNLGAPESIQLPRLIDLSTHETPGVRYFSGTATYRRDFGIAPEQLSSARDFFLDLGVVKNVAEVRINGVSLGTLWTLPFQLCVTSALKEGANHIEIEITNLWESRLIGDEQLADDCEWIAIPGRGWQLRKWPDWFVANRPRPSGRIAFATWRYYTKDDPLPESGLVGPVLFHSTENLRMEI
jgi:hypothetical protein